MEYPVGINDHLRCLLGHAFRRDQKQTKKSGIFAMCTEKVLLASFGIGFKFENGDIDFEA